MKTSKKKHQRWLIGMVSIWLSFTITVVAANFIIDPYVIFQGYGVYGNLVGNLRFGKINWLNKHNRKYNAYIFGSSRTSTFNPEDLHKYDPDIRYYNLWVQRSNPDDQLKHIKYMIENNWNVRKILIQYDLGPEFSVDPSFSLCRIHPNINRTSLFIEYLRYLVIFPQKDWRLTLKKKNQKSAHIYNQETGFRMNPALEARVTADPEKYIESVEAFHRNPKRRQLPQLAIIDKKISAIHEIKSLADANGIELIISVTAHHWAYLDALNKEAWLHELKGLADIMPIYNFAEYNGVTLNNKNYYESSHFRPHITKKIIDTLYQGSDSKDSFGVLLNKENIEEYIQACIEYR